MLSAEMLQALHDEIGSDPTGKGYAAHLPGSPGIVAELLNAPTERVEQERWVTALTILSECQSGTSIIRNLYTASQQDAVVLVAWNRLNSSTGLNVNDKATVINIDNLVTQAVLTIDEASELKAMAIQAASRAFAIGLPPVTIYDLIDSGVVK